MKISKTKYTVEFTEKEKEAITTICNITDRLYEDDLCTDLNCEDCPFYHNFCTSGDTNDLKINNIKEKLEKFLNKTN